MGLFFAVSGYNKLLVPETHTDLIHLMSEIGLSFPEFMALFLACVEFFSGILLMLGLFTSIWVIVLIIAMIVAIITVEIDAIIPKGISFLDWMSWFLYLPQVMYVILFVWLIIAGPGKLSFDYYPGQLTTARR